MLPAFIIAHLIDFERRAQWQCAESGVTAPQLCAVFGWGKLETA